MYLTDGTLQATLTGVGIGPLQLSFVGPILAEGLLTLDVLFVIGGFCNDWHDTLTLLPLCR